MFDISLIKNWHEKAKEDYFSRFVFEYLAFEVFLKKYKYSQLDEASERFYIQKIKSDELYIRNWRDLVKTNNELNKIVNEIITFLNNEPLHPTKNWWGCSEFKYSDCNQKDNKGIILNQDDFVNIVEFWNYVRNNLFHGNKNPNNERDGILVTYAYQSLSIFMEQVVLPEIEKRTVYPAVWEDFEHRFSKGEAELAIKSGNYYVYANIYELVCIDDNFFPVFLGDKKIERSYIINKLGNKLLSCADPNETEEEWNKILQKADTLEKKENLKVYFKMIIPYLKSTIGNIGI